MNDGKYDAVNVIYHIIIPKADHFIPKRFQMFRSLTVILLLFKMLTAIQFNNHFFFWTAKIRDVIPNGMLPSKIESQLVVADS